MPLLLHRRGGWRGIVKSGRFAARGPIRPAKRGIRQVASVTGRRRVVAGLDLPELLAECQDRFRVGELTGGSAEHRLEGFEIDGLRLLAGGAPAVADERARQVVDVPGTYDLVT